MVVAPPWSLNEELLTCFYFSLNDEWGFKGSEKKRVMMMGVTMKMGFWYIMKR
jgi:hypothetical protein